MHRGLIWSAANPRATLWVLPVSSLYSPSGQSTHSKQQVGSPSIIPFLVPGRQSLLQLEKGTCKKRAQRRLMVAVPHVQTSHSMTLGWLWGCCCLVKCWRASDSPLFFPLKRHTLHNSHLKPLQWYLFEGLHQGMMGKISKSSVISIVLCALWTGLWPMRHMPKNNQ